jgi:hypothetical protein
VLDHTAYLDWIFVAAIVVAILGAAASSVAVIWMSIH